MKNLKPLLAFFLLSLGIIFFSVLKVSADFSLSYQTPNYFEVNAEITPLVPSISGSGYTFSISPALPSGLSLEAATGIISGTPYALSLARNYTVTASTAGDSQSFTFSLATLFRPVTFSYENFDHLLTINRPIFPTIPPSVSQSGVTYSVSPDLPDGVIIDPISGVIGGFPTEVRNLASYVVTSQNPLGLATSSVSLAVPLPWTKLGDNIADSDAAAPALNFDYLQNNFFVPYVVYNNTSDSSLQVAKYSTASSSWSAVGNAIADTTATQSKIVFSSDHAPYISYLKDGGVFIRKYSSTANVWNSLSSSYDVNNNNVELGSALSNEATSHDIAVNLSGDAYEAYIANNALEIVKLVDNQAEYSTIDNLDYPTIPSNFSYGSSSLVFGSGSQIDYIIPSVSGKPATFASSPRLPLGLSIGGNSSGRDGLIYGTPFFASDETEYTITANNSLGSATTSLRLEVVGPWRNLTADIFSKDFVLPMSDTILEQAANGDFYLSYLASSANNYLQQTATIKKYDMSAGSWETIMTGREIIFDIENFTIEAEIVQAMTTVGDDLYVMTLDALINAVDEENPQVEMLSSIRKYDASSNSWEILGEFFPVSDPIMNPTEARIAVSGDDVFIASYAQDGLISIYQFDPNEGIILNYGSSIADFYPEHVNQYNNEDYLALAADESHLYVAYSDISNSGSGGDIVVNVLDKTSEEWTWARYVDDSATLNQKGYLGELSLDSFKLDLEGNPHVSFSYSGSYCDSGCCDDGSGGEICCDTEETADYRYYSAIKKLDLSTGAFTDIGLEYTLNTIDSPKDIISFDREGILWSSSAGYTSDGYEIKRYVDGNWVNVFPERQFVNQGMSLRYPELLFNDNDDIYVFSGYDNFSFLAKYEGTAAPLNYDYSVAPIISYPSASVTYVTGRKIDTLYPNLIGSISEPVSCLSGYCQIPSGLSTSRGVVYGTPLVATSTTIRFKAINSAGSSTFDLAINVVDPWVELGDPLSESAQTVSLAVDGSNKLWAAYSELSGATNEIRARKYDNESWGLMGGLVSDSGISASHPKIVSYLSNVYIAYREDSTGKLWVKKYNSQSGVWEVLGGAVTNYSSEYFDIDPAYSNGVSVIYYDDVSDHSVVKTFRNDYWEITGGYLEGGQYPSLSSADDKIYASYSTSAGRLSVENYEGFNSSSTGKEVPLANIGNLVAAGDMSPQGGLSATSTPAVKFNQRINLIPFAGASVVISAGTIMTANENFDSSLFTASSTVDLTDINPSFNPRGVLMVGLPDIGLSLSSPITISIPISGVAENTQLQVYSKSAGSSWSQLTTCYVIAGKCSFQTTHLSEFAAGTITSSSSAPVSSGGGSVPAVSVCTNVVYGDFSDTCFGGYQYRGIISKSPANCSLTSSQIEYARRTCRIGSDYSSNEGSLGEGLQSSTSSSISNGINDNNNLKPKENNSLWSEIRNKFIAAEKSLVKKVNNQLSKRLSGRILLQVEEKGESWYINPIDGFKYFLGRPDDAFNLMRKLALGINNKNFDSFKGKAPARLSGRILLKVEDSGKAYYVNPLDLKMYYLGRPDDAFNLMRNFGLGAKNSDIRQIMIGD